MPPAPHHRVCHPRPPVGAAGRVLDRQRPVEHERLAQRQVEVHGAGPPVDARSTRRGRRARASSARARRVASMRPDLDEPLRRAAVELDLVDRLPGADVAQLRRAVGGQHDQRHARLAAPRSPPAPAAPPPSPTCTRSRPGARSASPVPSAKKPATRSSTCDQARRPRLARQREHERRRARARRGARVAHAAAHQLVARGRAAAGTCRSRRSWKMRAMRTADDRPAPRLHADGRAAGGRRSRRWANAIAPLAPDIRGHGSAADVSAGDFASVQADVLRARARALRARRLLDGRPDRPVARARRARARSSGSCSSAPRPDSQTRTSAAPVAPPTRRLAERIERDRDRGVRRPLVRAPLFAGQPPRRRRRRTRDAPARNRPRGLAAALRGLGTGVMEPLWERLPS